MPVSKPSITTTTATLNGNIDTTKNAAGNAGAVSFTGKEKLGDNISITTDHATGTDGNIDFNNELDGANTLTVDGGTGTLNFKAAVGAGTSLASLVIQDAGDVNFDGTVNTTGDLTQSDGSGSTVFKALATIGGDATVVNDSVVFSGAGSINSNAGTGTVILTAQTGSITSGTAATDVTAGSLAARAATGIGTSSNKLSTDVDTLAASGGTGGVDVTNDGGLTIGTVDGLEGVSASGGQIDVSAASPLTVIRTVTNIGGGNISLSSTGTADADNLTIRADVTASGGNGNINLISGDDIIHDAGTVSTVGSGNIDYTTSGGTGGIAMSGTAKATAEDGDINMGAVSDISLTEVTSMNGDVDIESTAGAITDANGDILNVTANNFSATAATGIGTGGDPIEIDVNGLTTNLTGGGGSIFINNTNAGIADGVSTLIVSGASAPNGTFNLVTDGNVVLNNVATPGGVTQITANASIFGTGDAIDDIVANNTFLTARGGTIGIPGQPLTISTAGLNTFAGGELNGLSVNIVGNLSRDEVSFLNIPPGLMLFNNHVLGGGNISSLVTNTSIQYLLAQEAFNSYGRYGRLGNFSQPYEVDPRFIYPDEFYQSIVVEVGGPDNVIELKIDKDALAEI